MSTFRHVHGLDQIEYYSIYIVGILSWRKERCARKNVIVEYFMCHSACESLLARLFDWVGMDGGDLEDHFPDHPAVEAVQGCRRVFSIE
jgi:hypothetical protein